MKYADVYIDISSRSLDRPFQYLIPEELSDQARPGAAVMVPFGNGGRLSRGYITGISSRAEIDPARIKAIDHIISDRVNAEDRLMRLAAWIASSTGSTMNQAIKTVLPVKKRVKPRTFEMLHIKAEKDALEKQLEDADRKHYIRKAAVLRALIKTKESGISDISSKELEDNYLLLGLPAVITSLEKSGLISKEKKTSSRDPYSGIISFGAHEELIPLPDQQAIIDGINASYDKGEKRPALIHGITGSGKTLIYIELIKHVVSTGQQVIMLIPEISLTLQTMKRFMNAFGDRCSCLHSRLSDGERYDQFMRAKSGEIDVMVGPRSALFTPFEDLGMIIIDEEHEQSYQNEHSPSYNAVEVAYHISQTENVSLVLGSATPSLNSYYRAQNGIYKLYELKKRAKEGSVLPEVRLVDMREELKAHNRSSISRELKNLIQNNLNEHKQTMLFLNRRGYSGMVSCRECGKPILCPHCSVALSAHLFNGKPGKLMCHYCGYEADMPETCPSCGSKYIGLFGTGTQKVMQELKYLFPSALILRMDSDTTKGKGGHDRIIKAFNDHEADILIGTQMIVKGHDFPDVTLVGILAADQSFNGSEYSSAERGFFLTVQASGRAGRGKDHGTVIIQTYQPESKAVRYAAAGDYKAFYEAEIKKRAALQYPPVSNILETTVESADESELLPAAKRIHDRFKGMIGHIKADDRFKVLGPVQAEIYKQNDVYRMKIFLKCPDKDLLIRVMNDNLNFTVKSKFLKKVRTEYKFI
ncbi:MAG: primosomal protein N' [Lachnospiraceae bacterium]|nr:primosomal protein N' [Lachnospiraceae bacterium]MEE3460501.1 primosomal protein N' [Lachnospiraceae bacterium]